jgi:hypothetical protein
MQGSQTSNNPWQDANSSVAPTDATNTVYVVTEKIFGETLISVYSGLNETQISKNPKASQLSAKLDYLNTNSANIYDMSSRVSTALGEYKTNSTAFEGYNPDNPTIHFNLVDKSTVPENAGQRDLEICKRTVDTVDPQVAVDEATEALEGFKMT